jgi:alanyl-tRNA synthetase
MRVIADHARATAFLVADGVVPGNVERNYVLRRIMRRAIRHGERLGLGDLFFHEVCARVVDVMGSHYLELVEARDHIVRIAQQEEEQFRRTLRTGLRLLEREIADVKSGGAKEVPGDVVFFLHDTHGFPPDLTAVIAAEHGLGAGDPDKFRPKAPDEGGAGAALLAAARALHERHGATRTLFYEATAAEGRVLAVLDAEGRSLPAARAGDEVRVLTDRTPFYGESGGQVGDKGVIVGPEGEVEVADTQRPLPSLTLHVGRVRAGVLKVDDAVTLKVDHERRDAIRKNHSATHLMHWALRSTLGRHVRQAGSVVDPTRLRFDFNHYQKVTPEELRAIEKKVNAHVLLNAPTKAEEMSFAEAQERGALAFFGDKYGDRVRVVEITPDSVELCGGTHVGRSGDIGFFRFTGEAASSAGVRRVEAVTGMAAVELAQDAERELATAAAVLGVRPADVAARAERLLVELKEAARERDALRRAKAAAGAGDLLAGIREVAGVKALAARVDVVDPAELRDLGDKLKGKMGDGVLMLAGVAGEKVSLVVLVSAPLTGRIKAGNIMKEVAPLVGGKGGGRPDMAQGGGNDPAGVDRAIERFYELVAA